MEETDMNQTEEINKIYVYNENSIKICYKGDEGFEDLKEAYLTKRALDNAFWNR